MIGKGEMLLTILSSLSQEESHSISENVTWGLRKKFADCKFSVGYSRFLGYDKGEDGNLAINEEQAKTVRIIFGLFIEGLTPCAIAKELTRRGILTVTGKSKWNAATINGVLANEKYTGCARIQKTFTPDFLTKKTVKNTGQVLSYFVEQSHPAIIDPATFEMVQNEIARRKQDGGRYSGVSIFASKIKCGECGGWFGAKVWHSNDKYRRVIYRCNHKYGGHKCHTPHVTEREVKTAFVTAFNRILFLPTHHSLHDVDKFHNVLRRIFGVQDSIGDGIFLAPIASERDQGRMDSVPKVNGNHWSPGIFRIVKHIEIIWWDIMDMDLRMIFLNLIAQVVDIGCIAALHHEDGFAI